MCERTTLCGQLGLARPYWRPVQAEDGSGRFLRTHSALLKISSCQVGGLQCLKTLYAVL